MAVYNARIVKRTRGAHAEDGRNIKNNLCVIMWSTGNESGHGPNHLAMISGPGRRTTRVLSTVKTCRGKTVPVRYQLNEKS